MNQNLKLLGILVLTVIAMSAVAAPSASAQTPGELTSDDPVKLDMTELAGGPGVFFSLFGGILHCPGSVLTGFKYNITPHEPIPSGSTTFTVIADYNQANCRVTEGATTHKATVTTNGCDYVVHIGTTSAGKYPLTVDIICTVGKAIEIEVYPFAGSELGGVACIIKIGTQGGLTGPKIATTEGSFPHDLKIEGTFTELEGEKSGAACATESTTTGTFGANATVEGTGAFGGSTGITVTD